MTKPVETENLFALQLALLEALQDLMKVLDALAELERELKVRKCGTVIARPTWVRRTNETN